MDVTIMVKHALTLALVSVLCNLGFADICTWNGAIGNWNDLAKWDCGSIPGPGDTVAIASGTVNLDMDREIAVLFITGGLISGADTLTITDSVAWSGGSFSGCIVECTSSSGVAIFGSAQKYMNNGGSLVFYGQVNHTASLLSLGGGFSRMVIMSGATYDFSGGAVQGVASDSLINYGTFDIGHDAQFGNGSFVIRNESTMLKSSGSGTLNLGCTLIQNGTMTVTSGNLVKFYSVTLSNTSTTNFDTSHVFFDQNGTIDTFATVLGGRSYTFEVATFRVKGSIPNDKTIHFDAGTVYLDQQCSTADTIRITGATIAGQGKLISQGVCYWTSGKINLPFEQGVSGEMYLQSSHYKHVEGSGRIEWKGTVQLTDGFLWVTTSDSVILHATGVFNYDGGTVNGWNDRVFLNRGTFNIAFDATISGGYFRFINDGTIIKTSGTGTLNFDCIIVNNGHLDIGPSTAAIFKIATFKSSSSNDFGSGFVYFEGELLVDTLAIITNGLRYIFSGYSITVNGVIPSGKQLVFEGNTTILNRDYVTADTVWLTGNSAIAGSGELVINGVFIWTGGKIRLHVKCGSTGGMFLSTSGVKNLENPGRLDLEGSLYLTDGKMGLLNADTLYIHNEGEFHFDGGSMSVWNDQVVVNNGLFTMSFDGLINGGFSEFINNGTFEKTDGEGLAVIACEFHQKGDLTVLAGSRVRFSNSYLHNGSQSSFDTSDVEFDYFGGTIDTFAGVSGGDRYIFGGSNVYVKGNLPSNKKLRFESGIVNFDIDYATVDSVDFINSTVEGSGALTMAGHIKWESGRLGIPFTILEDGELYAEGGSYRELKANGKIFLHGAMYLNEGTFGLTNNDTVRIETGGIFEYSGGIISGGGGEVMHNMGTLRVTHPGTFDNGSMQLINDGTFVSDNAGGTIIVNNDFTNNGDVHGNGTISFDNLINNGTFSPGFSIDILNVIAGFENSGSAIAIEISGYGGPGVGHDLLEIDGDVTLHGQITVELIDGFEPDSGFCFPIITSTGIITDSFDITTLPGSSPEWKILYNPGEVLVQYFQIECASDDTLTTDPDQCSHLITDNTFDLNTIHSCGDMLVFNNWNGLATLHGESIEVGVHDITWYADDGHGDTLSCNTTITVVDDQLPLITCPADMSFSISTASCDTVINYEVVVVDNCPAYNLTILNGLTSGAAFNVGTHLQEYLVSDISANTAQCTFRITVNPTVVTIYDTICLGDSIYLEGAWQYTAGMYIDTFQNALSCDSIVYTHLNTTTQCYWPTEIVYVDSAATGNNTGDNWTNAYIDLQYALDVARRYLNITQVWIAAGTYYPTHGNSRSSAFMLTDSVGLYGGFEGTESVLNERDPLAHPVVLSGDIGSSGDQNDNSFHIVVCQDTTEAALLDGVILSDANANGSTDEDQVGAGLLNYGKMYLRHCLFQDLFSILSGNAIYTSGASAKLTLEDVTVLSSAPEAVLIAQDAMLKVKGNASIR